MFYLWVIGLFSIPITVPKKGEEPLEGGGGSWQGKERRRCPFLHSCIVDERGTQTETSGS